MQAPVSHDAVVDEGFVSEFDASLWTAVYFIFDMCVDVVTHVPVVFRCTGIMILFLVGWGLNIYGMDAAGVNFRAVLGMAPNEGRAIDVFRGAVTFLLAFVFASNDGPYIQEF